ncbi:MAG: aspartate aminotransferase family protein [Bacteroidetes bacterium]|nr:MAG: aspartate aminotransferase family protein [Bacteroidota bacterium]
MRLSNASIQSKSEQFVALTQQIPYAPIAFARGEGALLYTHDGQRFIDFLSSACSANLGHGNQEIAEAVGAQMAQLTQYTFAYFNTAPAVQLAEELCSLVPGGHECKALFSNTGSASIDAAIKLARGFTGRKKILSMVGAYHGSTYGAISVSALSLNMRRKIGAMMPNVFHFHYPDRDHSWQSCIAEMEEAFSMYLDPQEVAAIIIEPIAGDMGLLDPPKEWMQALRSLCDQHGILLVSDEIQLALCRTGRWFCIEHFDVEADLYVMGKSVGGGLPMGVVLGRKEIIDCLEAPAHVFTLSACAAVSVAALKNLEILKRIDGNRLSQEKGEYLKGKFEALKDKYAFIGDIRGYGLSIGVDIINPETGERDPIATSKICYECFKRGVVLIFLNGATLRVQPPLVIEYEQMDEAMRIIESAMRDYSEGKIGDEVLKEIKGW